MPPTSPARYAQPSLGKIILLAGLLAGTLDILSALADVYITTGKNPLIVFRYIASAVMGKKAFSGGNEMLWLGLLLHYVIAFAFTLFFFWIYPRIPALSINRIMTAIVYGLFVWAVMNLIVLPQVFGRFSFKLDKAIKAAVILIVMIGVPLSFMAHAYFRKQKTGV